METLETLKKSGLAPGDFWFISTMALTGILVLVLSLLTFFIKGYLNDRKKMDSEFQTNIKQNADTNTKTSETLVQVKEILKHHEYRFGVVDDQVLALRADIRDFKKS
jgi:uncharacterized protein YneF (UPF0154 family)